MSCDYRGSTRRWFLLGWLALAVLAPAAGAYAEDRGATRGVERPVVEGPVTGGKGIPGGASTTFDLATVGYAETEWFISGTARAYTSDGPLDVNGKWTASAGESAAYKTRIRVCRPVEAGRFNGTVIVEWLNVSGGIDAAADWIMMHTELIREGYIWVGVSAQYVGVEGGPGMMGMASSPLKGTDPERYGSLAHPGDSFSYDIFTQAARAIREPGEVDALGGLRPEAVIAESPRVMRYLLWIR